jgi:hypothetical protein
MAGKAAQVVLRLDNVRMSFPSLWKATSVKDGDKPAFSAQFIFPPEHPCFAVLKQTLVKVAQDQWGHGPIDIGGGKMSTQGIEQMKALMATNAVCLKNGSMKRSQTGEVLDGYVGQWFISARSQTKPSTWDAAKQPITEAMGKLYSGCYVNAVVAIWAQTGQYGKRINAQLMGVQFAKDGDAFGGGRAATSDLFESLASEFGDAQNAAGSPVDDAFFSADDLT